MTDIASQQEIERLAALRSYEILDTPPDGAFDRITALAARHFHVPVALVSLVDEDRIWFKSRHGLDADQIPRSRVVCFRDLTATRLTWSGTPSKIPGPWQTRWSLVRWA